jgi:hypothetical protein
MTEQQFRTFYPLIAGWIQKTLADHATAAQPVTSFSFGRLPRYYSHATLTSAKVVIVPKVPVPPLSAMGPHQFVELETIDAWGITYLDTYFVRPDRVQVESLHFHELVHVIQWRLLGTERFVAIHADGLERFGYRNSPLEKMAYDFQDRFDRGGQPFNVEAECHSLLQQMGDVGSKNT